MHKCISWKQECNQKYFPGVMWKGQKYHRTNLKVHASFACANSCQLNRCLSFTRVLPVNESFLYEFACLDKLIWISIWILLRHDEIEEDSLVVKPGGEREKKFLLGSCLHDISDNCRISFPSTSFFSISLAFSYIFLFFYFSFCNDSIRNSIFPCLKSNSNQNI